MELFVQASLDYQFADPTDVLLQLEAAAIAGQRVTDIVLDVAGCEHFVRIPAQDDIGERIWLSI